MRSSAERCATLSKNSGIQKPPTVVQWRWRRRRLSGPVVPRPHFLCFFYREIARAFSMTPSAVVNFRSGNNIMKGSCFLSASLVPPVSRSLALALEPSHIHYPRCKRKRTVKMVAAIPPPPRLARPDTGCCPSPTIQRVGCNLLLFRHRECGTKVSSYDVVPKICSGFGTPCLRAS